MVNVYDLHFTKEILPLFDYLYNEHSREMLGRLMAEMPGSVEDIHYRQNILKSLLQHDHLFVPIFYSKVEFNQVYGYIEEKRIGGHDLTGIPLKAHFLFAPAARNREKSGLYQFYYFFHKIQLLYFSRLRTEFFPAPFRDSCENIQRMLVGLQVEKYYAVARERGLNLPETARLAEMLQKKMDEGEMDSFWKDFFLFEAWYSIAKGIHTHRFNFPSFGEGPLMISGFYHPLLRFPVRNSLMATSPVLLITGPNMSGKSTLLKSVGLCVYLAHLGLAVPAEHCVMPFFDVISVAIHLNDDLQQGYSHFMTEIQTLKKLLVQARGGRRCFAIFDELFRGTNIDDALAISRSTIKGLTAFKDSYFLISTHLHQLEEMAAMDEIQACFIDCELEGGRPVFTYKLKPGWSDLKLGQLIFQQEGLDELLEGR
jgi:DNA mismatch repair protein MutS